jgi:hypothetical protein
MAEFDEPAIAFGKSTDEMSARLAGVGAIVEAAEKFGICGEIGV